MERNMEQQNGGSTFAVITGAILAIFNNLFNVDPLFIQNIRDDAFKSIVVGFLGAFGALVAKGAYAFCTEKIKAFKIRKQKPL